jgi:hypothetical protein
VGAALFGSGPPARAGYIEVDYSIDGGAKTMIASGNGSAFFSGTLGGQFNVSLGFAASGSPASLSQGLAYNPFTNNYVSALYANDGSGTTHTLTIYVSSTGFTVPTGNNLTLGSSASITEVSGGTTVSFTSYADTSNALWGMTGPSTSIVPFSVSGGQSGSANASTLFSTVGSNPYSLTNVGSYTMLGGTNITLVGGTTTVTTPAPPGLFMALTGLPFLAVGGWLRFRRK